MGVGHKSVLLLATQALENNKGGQDHSAFSSSILQTGQPGLCSGFQDSHGYIKRVS